MGYLHRSDIPVNRQMGQKLFYILAGQLVGMLFVMKNNVLVNPVDISIDRSQAIVANQHKLADTV